MTISKSDPNYIKWLIANSDEAVEKAMVAIYNRQTAAEQRSGQTVSQNGEGFSGAHDKLGTYYARWVLSGRQLTGKHLVKARTMAYSYVRQLSEIAAAREAARAAIQDSIVES